jgi:hypothetical protein
MYASKIVLSIACFALTAMAAADPQLARDVEALRNSLPLKDSARPTLTLRLADVLFDQAVELGGNPTPGDAEKAQLKSARTRALALYTESINGIQYHPGVQGALSYKIKFQMARLLTELGQVENANKYWKELVAQEELTDLRREASLRLAEYYEKLKTPVALKEADQYYKLSIELCGEGDVCAYGHYRRAWALREANNLPAAITEMQVALFDSKGQVRDEALRDLIVFLSAEQTDGEKALLLVEQLATRTGRPNLYEDLAEAFYSTGNRQAGTRALEHVNARTPTLQHQIRLMEEYYGLRNWDKFRAVMDQAASKPAPAEGVDPKTEKILRRLSVQLDGERASRAEFGGDFKSVVLLYMHLFPKHKDQFKMMEGWIAAETDPAAKMKKIEEWVNTPDIGITKAEEIKLREIRLALAVKGKDSAIIEGEAAKLASLVTDPARIREYRYIQSVSIKEQGRVDEAYALLKTWALPTAQQDTWTFRGGLMQVDILLDKKVYSEIAKTSGEWADSATVLAAAKTAKEKKVWDDGLALLNRVREEAKFEAAIALGEKPEALVTFQKYCTDGKFLPKSCENARVLAVKLKDQKAILALLKHMNRESELAAEYEAAGFFAESAQLQEKELNAKSDDAAYLRVALLYELGGHFPDRNRLLTDITKRMKARKSAGEHENIIYATLKDAKMLGPEALDLPWSEDNKLLLANALELEGKGSERTRRELLASKRSAGVAWTRYVMEELSKLDQAQRKISFYGRKGQVKFKQRLAAMQALDAGTEKYYAGGDSKSRARIAILLHKAYKDFSNEILNSPTPEGLSPEVMAEVKASLTAMAEPFVKKASDFEGMARQQLGDIAQVSERAALEALLLPDTESTKVAKVDYPPATATASVVPDVGYKQALGQLHEDPASASALTEIKGFYESQGKQRLASYFQGRLLQLGTGKGEKL